jgi:hypothetical protein
MWEPGEYTGGTGAFEWNDGSNFPSTQYSNPNPGNEGIGLLHSKHGGNALVLDGHVQFVTTVQFNSWSTQIPNGKTYLWWAPNAANGD